MLYMVVITKEERQLTHPYRIRRWGRRALACLLAMSLLAPAALAESVNSWEAESYKEYAAGLQQQAYPDGRDRLLLQGAAAAAQENTEVLTAFEGWEGDCLLTGETGYAEWNFSVETTGLYTIRLRYYPYPGKGSAIERSLLLDGEVPFSEAGSVSFPRIWVDERDGAFQTDTGGNDITPTQKEAPAWTEGYLADPGASDEPFTFYLEAGKSHTLRLTSVKEPMAIGSLEIAPRESLPSYDEVKAAYDEAGYRDAGKSLTIQAEGMASKSASTIYPTYNRSSPGMIPCSTSSIRLNMVGGEKWQEPGQWIRWTVDTVEESGLYKIAVRYKQDLLSGAFVTRSLKINGEFPFEEAKKLTFTYDNGWQVCALGDGERTFEFYFEKGKTYELELCVSLGEMADILSRAQDSVGVLNSIYRQILMVTGSEPDPFRDYQFSKLIPDTLRLMEEQYAALSAVLEDIQAVSGINGQRLSTLRTVLFDLKTMVDNPVKISNTLKRFQTNTGALAAWVLDSKKQPLELDWISLLPPEAKLPAADKGFFSFAWLNISLFLHSFVQDYYTVDAAGGGQAAVTVWVGSGNIGGRDQAQILRRMIDDTYTPGHGVTVDVQLVAPGTLMLAALSGTGPDVSLQTPITDPMNYAVRGAVKNLMDFPDAGEVLGRFHPGAVLPYQFEGGTYALPETYSYPMLFYRKDILSELGFGVPETWDDVYTLIPELHKHSMQFGLPTTFDMYAMLLYQNGGRIYTENGDACLLDNETAIRTFEQWGELYTDYKLQLTYDFVNRFRTGEMPVAIADFTLFNQLTVFAPEMRGRWDFTVVPGTMREDGTVDHSAPGTGVSAIMMTGAKNPDAAWDFMKWWTEADTQVRFAGELESYMGPAARYPAANLEAIRQIPWPAAQYDSLMEQWDWVEAIPQVPGGYITTRYIDFAFKAVVNRAQDPGEQLMKYVKQINAEIRRKRAEFGLS